MGGVDLNLIRTFVAIYELGSLTAAAERLYVSQSAVSQSLAKLRHSVADPLFHRDGRRMVPTRLAETLYPEFRGALARIDRALDDARDFDATLVLQRRELTGAAMARALLRYPLMTMKVVAAIHWQALRLWLKRTPVHDHPATAARRAATGTQR